MYVGIFFVIIRGENVRHENGIKQIYSIGNGVRGDENQQFVFNLLLLSIAITTI